MSRQARDDDPTVQACFARCRNLNPMRANRRATRETNRAELNRQNRETRQEREQGRGTALLGRVEQAINVAQGSDDPCARKLQRLERLVAALQGRLESEQSGRPAVERTGQSGRIVPRARASASQVTRVTRVARQSQPRSANLQELEEPRVARAARQSQSRSANLQELEEPQGIPGWVTALKSSKTAGETQSTWEAPLRAWLTANQFPQPPNPSPGSPPIRMVALYLRGSERADKDIASWKREHGPAARARWNQQFGAGRGIRRTLGAALSDDLATLTSRIRQGDVSIPPGSVIEGTSAQRLARLAQLIQVPERRVETSVAPVRESGRLAVVRPRRIRRTARLPVTSLVGDLSAALGQAREAGFTLPAGFTTQGTPSRQMSDIVSAMRAPPQVTPAWAAYISNPIVNLSATQPWASQMVKWLKYAGFPLEGVRSFNGTPTQSDILATARYLVGIYRASDERADGFVFWRGRFGPAAMRAYTELLN